MGESVPSRLPCLPRQRLLREQNREASAGSLTGVYDPQTVTITESLLACDGHQRLGCHRICVQGLQQLHLGVHLFAEGLGFPDSAITVASVGATLFEVQSDALHGSEGALHLGLIRGMVGDREGAIVDIQRVLSRPSAFRPQMLRHDSMFASMLEDPRLRRFVETPGVVP